MKKLKFRWSETGQKVFDIFTALFLLFIWAYCIYLLKNVFFSMLLGFILYAIFSPLYKTLAKYIGKLMSIGITTLSLLFLFLIIVSVGAFLSIDVYEEMMNIDFSQYIDAWSSYISSLSLPADPMNYIEKIIDSMPNIQSWIQSVFTSLSKISNIFLLSTVFFYVFLSEPHWLKRLGTSVDSIAPDANIKTFFSEIKDTLYIWCKAQAIVGLYVMWLVSLYFVILSFFVDINISTVFSMAFLAFFAEFIPVIWPIITFIPLLVVSSSLWTSGVIAAGVFFVIFQIVESYILIPKVVGGKLRVPASFSIITLIIGGTLFWVLWIILSLPIWAVLYKKISDKL